MSAERQVKTQRLGSSIYHAQKAYSRGRAMTFQIFRDGLQFDTLDGMQQQLVGDFHGNASLKKLTQLMKARSDTSPCEPYAGTATEATKPGRNPP